MTSVATNPAPLPMKAREQVFASYLRPLLAAAGVIDAPESLPPLVLHVDLNRTIIQVDKAGGKSLLDILNNNLSTACLGYLSPDAATWTACDAATRASLAGADLAPFRAAAPAGHTLVTYDEYVDDHKCAKPAAMASLPKDEALALWKQVTAGRRALKNVFSEPGQPGACFRDLYDQMYQKMLIPGRGANGETFFVIPSFYFMCNALSAARVPFKIVFRTFGQEILVVLKDVQRLLFATADFELQLPEGGSNSGTWATHFCGPALTALAPQVTAAVAAAASLPTDAPLASAQFPWCPVAALYRDDAVGHLLCTGTHISPAAAAAWDGNPNASATSLQDLYTRFTTVAPERPFEGFVDHYPWWAAHAEHETAGKIFPVRVPAAAEAREAAFEATHPSPREGEAPRGEWRPTASSSGSASANATTALQVFFDDNIYIGDEEGHSIVDLRDVATGEHIFDPALQRRFLVRVDPMSAILRPDYFVSRLVECAVSQLALYKQK
jgi:hypothetical protein